MMGNRNSHPWLLKRAEMFAAIAKSDFKQEKKVEFHFDDPEAGWVDMTIKFDGEPVAELSLTDAWGTDPMRGLLDLMEANIDSCEIPHYFFHDGEREVYIFHFEDIAFPGIGYRDSNGFSIVKEFARCLSIQQAMMGTTNCFSQYVTAQIS